MASSTYPEPLERAFLAGAAMLLRIDLSGVLVPATAFLCPRAIQLGPPQLWLRAPTLANDRPFPAALDTAISVSYLVSGQRYAFDTWITSIRPYPGGRGVTLWIVRAPATVLPQQRRAAVRLSRWVRPMLRMRLWTIGAAASPAGGPGLMDGTIEDLSTAGVGLLLSRAAARRFPVSCVAGLNFRLLADAAPIVLRGVVRTRRSRGKSGLVKLGIAFLEATSHADHTRSIDQVMRYVTEQERIQIQRDREGR
jgi:hypothetical protein